MVSADPGERIRTGGQVQAGRGGVPEEEAAPALGAGTAGTENHIFRLPSVPEALRDWLERRTRHHTLSPGTRSLMRALILARRETLDREVLDAYSYLGISHFLALSGLHLGIIGLAVSGAIRSSLGSGWMAQVLLLAVLAVYTSATGSPPSLVRAMALLVAFR
ncbi:MAG TPA: ComEC/Rec2 family competence protein, partial [Candidatus Krumholzibacterium sp.]|nr:ComEC/Rec2 family competence protein [Candidatus Krumholzibacterium sp.]